MAKLAAGKSMAGKSASRSYGNFRDPIGLAKRMLLHRDPIARWTMLEALLGVMMIPIDLGLGIWERVREHRPADVQRSDGTEHPLVLVVGPPRSGSTMVSQLLLDQLDVSYFPNLCNIFPRAPITAARMMGLERPVDRENLLRSFYGNTAGWRGMSDGFVVWNRWFGNDRYRVAADINADKRQAMREFFRRWTTAFDRPLLNKNNRNVDAISQLSEILPHAYFVVVTREPFFVAQSLLQAREFVQGDRRCGWGLYSTDVPIDDPAKSQDDEAQLRSVCQQVLEINHRIDAQLCQLPRDRFLVLDYADICQAPGSAVERVVEMVPGLRLRSAGSTRTLEPLAVSDRIRLRADEAASVRQLLMRPHGSLSRETA